MRLTNHDGRGGSNSFFVVFFHVRTFHQSRASLVHTSAANYNFTVDRRQNFPAPSTPRLPATVCQYRGGGLAAPPLPLRPLPADPTRMSTTNRTIPTHTHSINAFDINHPRQTSRINPEKHSAGDHSSTHPMQMEHSPSQSTARNPYLITYKPDTPIKTNPTHPHTNTPDPHTSDKIHIRSMTTSAQHTQNPQYRGGEELVRAYFGKAKFGEGKFWYKILNSIEKCGTNFPNHGQTGK